MICTTALVYIDTLALITHIAESVNLSIKYVFFLVQSLLTAVNQRFCDLLTTGFLRLSKNMETFSPTLWVHKSSSTELSDTIIFIRKLKLLSQQKRQTCSFKRHDIFKEIKTSTPLGGRKFYSRSTLQLPYGAQCLPRVREWWVCVWRTRQRPLAPQPRSLKFDMF